jgi:Cft2 family RNA processing exonuclease
MPGDGLLQSFRGRVVSLQALAFGFILMPLFFSDFFLAADYQGLTRSFCHGTIYCSSITAKLVNMKIGIPWDRLQILPLNQKINIAGIGVTCLDANHCPGSIMILFEPANGKVWSELTSSYTIL